MRIIVTTSVSPTEILRLDLHAQEYRGRLVHQDLPRDVYVVHPDTYGELVDHLGPLEAAGIAVDDLTDDERAEALDSFGWLRHRIFRGELVPGKD